MKAIIFDLDGVICHTDEYHYQAWKTLADSLDIAFDHTVNNRLRGVSRMESLDILLEPATVTFSQGEKEAFATDKNERYRQLLCQMTTDDLSTEVRETLHSLRERGLKLAIGSSSKNASLILDRVGLGNFFDAVADGNMITHSKPDPEVFQLAAELIGMRPDDCAVVEDAAAGIQAAKAAGMTAIAVGDAVNSTLADIRLNHFAQLLTL